MYNMPPTPVRERDFLNVDPPIRGQAYACLSIICPENVLKQKAPFFFNSYLTKFSTDLQLLFETLTAKYPDDRAWIDNVVESHAALFSEADLQDAFKMYTRINAADLEDKFHRLHDFETTTRGLKIRGVYSSLEEARARALQLQKSDPVHNVWVAEVGAWVPIADNPESMKEEVYQETQLNTLMQKYTENNDMKDTFFQERKRVMNDGIEPYTAPPGSRQSPFTISQTDADAEDAANARAVIKNAPPGAETSQLDAANVQLDAASANASPLEPAQAP